MRGKLVDGRAIGGENRRMRVRGGALTSIDLFCGAGGITEGFRQAGFTCLYGNDNNASAIATFKENHPAARIDDRDVEDIDPAQIRRDLSLEPGELSVLAGGPPCQGFSINAPERFLDDPRNKLFRHYIRFLDEFHPQTFVFENVPGMLSLAAGHVFDQVMRQFLRRGYHIAAKVLFAAHYGVPQERWRVIILGSLREPSPDHPYPTHFATARANFYGGRTLTFRLEPSERKRLLPAVTVGQAIGDLPRLGIGQGGEAVPYDRTARSAYAKSMRDGNIAALNHFAAKLAPQNIERLKYIKPGGSWRDIPHNLLPRGMQRARLSDHTKRYGRLENDGLAGTIMTKCDPHWGPVFLPDQDRSLTVREAARLQSFPDSYRFIGSRVSQYEQVGNAVPPLMARAIAQSLAQHITADVPAPREALIGA